MATKKIQIDPEFQALIRPLAPEEYAALESSLLAEGCRHKLVTWRGILIDGHNRREICLKHGITFDTTENISIHSRDEAIIWMLNNQLARRNLDKMTRVSLAEKMTATIAARAKANQAHGETAPGVTLPANSPKASIDTREEIAKRAKVSSNTVSKVKRIEAKAIPAIAAAARSESISINAAAKLAKLPVEEQQRVAAGGIEGMKAVARQETAKTVPPAPVGGTPTNSASSLPQEEKDALKARIVELERSLIEKDARIVELEQSQTEKDARVAELEQSLNDLQEEHQRLRAMLEVHVDLGAAQGDVLGIPQGDLGVV